MKRTLTTNTGNTLQIEEKPFASGGEGSINIVCNSDLVAKLFTSNIKLHHYERKIMYMIDYPPFGEKCGLSDITTRVLIWPKNLLYEKQSFVGFTMKKLSACIQSKYLTLLDINKSLARNWEVYSRKDPCGFLNRLKICKNLAEALKLLHSTGNYVMFDLKPENVMLQSNGYLSLIDLDSIQIGTKDKPLWLADVATGEYAPPEYNDWFKNKYLVSKEWDYFSYAVIAYEILIGIPPFQATLKVKTVNNSIIQNIKNNYFVHGKNRKKLEAISDQHELFNNLPKSLQKLFIQTFDNGHSDIFQRVTPQQWIEALNPLIKNNKYCNYVLISKQEEQRILREKLTIGYQKFIKFINTPFDKM